MKITSLQTSSVFCFEREENNSLRRVGVVMKLNNVIILRQFLIHYLIYLLLLLLLLCFVHGLVKANEKNRKQKHVTRNWPSFINSRAIYYAWWCRNKGNSCRL